jgi:hypothetical protein
MQTLQRELVLRGLPQRLLDSLAAVEAVLGRQVSFVVNPNLTGLALAKASSNGTIHFAPATAKAIVTATEGLPKHTMGVIGEEIMHLRRRAEHYPAIQPQFLASVFEYADSISVLSGFFEEHEFFPSLEASELTPRDVVTETITESVKKLPTMLERIKEDGDTAKWRVTLSTLFVQGSLMAPESEARTRLMEFFDDPRLEQYAGLGRSLVEEIRAAAGRPPLEVADRMRRCVDLLQLSAKGAIVTFPPFPSN